MLFTRSRRSKISRRSDFTPVKKAEVKSHAGVKKSKIGIWCMSYEKKNLQEMVIILFL